MLRARTAGLDPGVAWQSLHRWVVDNGYAFTGPCRELYIRAVTDDQSDWVTELQQPVTCR